MSTVEPIRVAPRTVAPELPTLAAILIMALAVIPGCTTLHQRDACPPGRQNLPDCPPLNAVVDDDINRLYNFRTWLSPGKLTIDTVELGKKADIPIQGARTKFIGTTSEDALNSLAAKIWMIENAEHTIDFTYYIFKPDLIGHAMLGALCNAVKRGVDVRVMVDSLGSISIDHASLKALVTCSDGAGFMRNANGQLTTKKSRVQVLIFNALSKVFIKFNRRSHDKLLVVDGMFEDQAIVMTGGRNISLSYFGINADGSPNPDTYMDAEILLRTSAEHRNNERTVGEVSDAYYSILFFFNKNKRLLPVKSDSATRIYRAARQKSQASLAELKRIPVVADRLVTMPRYMTEDFHESEVRLAHELGNLTNRNVESDAIANLKNNPNSITYLLKYVASHDYKLGRIVSPYLFMAEYSDTDGNVTDGAKNIRDWLEDNPDSTLEIITNSVLTSDNFPAQAIIDMNMAPRLLLPDDMQKAWLEKYEDSENNPLLVESEEWRRLINHPRLRIYETGRLDDTVLGGDIDYGKLHAKYIVTDDGGFVGTTNFDDRSRLRNNEMGFFFEDPELAADIHADFERLKSMSYRWGSPEWLEMRRQLIDQGGKKGSATRRQRTLYKALRATGLDRQF